MFCKNCGSELKDGARFCGRCGAPVQQGQASTDGSKKKRRPRKALVAALIAAGLVLVLAGGWIVSSLLGGKTADTKTDGNVMEHEGEPQTSQTQPEEEAPVTQEPSAPTPSAPMELLQRVQLLHFSSEDASPVTAAVAPYAAAPDLSNVTNLGQFYLTDEQQRLLAQNLFVVTDGYSLEFFETYEENRYFQVPNFVTVDSMMHTYHLYFSLLLSRTEKNYLASSLLELSRTMLQSSLAQYDALTGTAWEEAARRNVAFFAVAAALQDAEVTIPDCASALAAQELDAVYAADRICQSALAEELVDYSQFKPRGYYEGDAALEAYFRAMMWYGQINFTQKAQSLNRSALLMTLAMQEDGLAEWERIYTVTSFFAGASDDLSYYEYAPAVLQAYGAWPTAQALAEDEAAYERFTALIAQMEPPAINSVPVLQAQEGDVAEMKKGFRFMGQRFTIDAAVMQQLVYRNVEENSAGEKRLLPDVLDMAAALGSDVALDLLTEQGETDYSGYLENMTKLRNTLQNAPDTLWSSSLYSSWLYTLSPLLAPKAEGYPAFMRSTQWLKKDLETYAGSFTELKHDTVLYSKQVMAEMGGGPIEVIDDRGYVEPETEVYRRFQMLAQQTADGLQDYGLIGDEELENLTRLAELAGRLMTISQKELQNQTLTDEEYELIRGYGGTLEHFWIEAVKDKSESEWLDPQEIPAPVVTDIATDPNGRVLQIATGRPSRIFVIVPVDGQLRLASGMVYDFYQFEQPLSNRLTDTAWRQMIGVWQNADGGYNWDTQVEKPWWTQSYWARS